MTKLISTTAESKRKNPRCVLRNASGVVEVQLKYPICLETYDALRPLGRFLLRTGGVAVVAGLVTDVLSTRAYHMIKVRSKECQGVVRYKVYYDTNYL